MLPGMATMASSPSQVLQIQPFFENFCTYPARSPVEYVHETTNQVYKASSATGTAITAAMMSLWVRESVNVTPENLVPRVALVTGANRGIGLEVGVGTVRATLETNTLGPLQLCQTLAPLMIAHRYGRIVNVTSGYGQMDSMTSRTLAYKISKLALNGITRILADELRDSGVLVNAVDPGWVRTDMGGAGAPRSASRGADTAVFLATLPDGGPTGRLFRDRREVHW